MSKAANGSELDHLPVPLEFVERRIYLIRGQKVMLDSDLAELYQVETRALIQAIKRNQDRFPDDFMFQLSKEEVASLRSQIVISNIGRGGRRYLPYAFTEHGVAMLSSVLNSKRAVQMNILIIRAFVKLRELLASHKDLADKIAAWKRPKSCKAQRLPRSWLRLTVSSRLIGTYHQPLAFVDLTNHAFCDWAKSFPAAVLPEREQVAESQESYNAGRHLNNPKRTKR